jgi:hypothetical protein
MTVGHQADIVVEDTPRVNQRNSETKGLFDSHLHFMSPAALARDHLLVKICVISAALFDSNLFEFEPTILAKAQHRNNASMLPYSELQKSLTLPDH